MNFLCKLRDDEIKINCIIVDEMEELQKKKNKKKKKMVEKSSESIFYIRCDRECALLVLVRRITSQRFTFTTNEKRTIADSFFLFVRFFLFE